MSFSTRRDTYKGHPILEVLEDGQPWGEDKPYSSAHFRFGETIAKLMLTAEEPLRTFVYTDARRPNDEDEIIIEKPSIGIACRCVKETGFSRGETTINKPYIKLSGPGNSIGLGLRKAEALLDVWSDVELFILGDDPIDEAFDLPF